MQFKDHKVSEQVRLLVVGDSGSGKTTMLADLANAGFKVRIFDFDDGLDSLGHRLKPEAVQNVHFATLKDPLTGKAVAWKEFKRLLLNWKTESEDLGSPSKWDTDTVLVIDSGTFMGDAAKHDACSMNGKNSFDLMTQPEWGEAIRQVEAILNFISSDSFKCHIIVTALAISVEDDAGISRLYPQFVTKAFSAKVPRFFNNVVLVGEKRDGSRYLRTCSTNRISLKVSSPKLDKEIDADLVKLFRALTSTSVKPS